MTELGQAEVGEPTKGALLPALRTVLRHQAISMLGILALLWVVLAFLSPYFFTVDNLFEITLQTAVIAIIGAGMTFVILSGGIDLSVGSVFACSAIVGGLAFNATHSLVLGLVVTAATGALYGLLNGLLITVLRVPPFIGTLGMMGIARGFALIFVNGVPIYGLERYKFLGQGKVLQVIPVPTVIVLVVFVLGFLVLNYTRFGRFTYVIGSNIEAARLSGVAVRRVQVGIYATCGLLTGIASTIEAGRLGIVQPAGGTDTSYWPSGR